MVVQHDVKFERNTRTGRWRAYCSCFWVTVGTSDEVQKEAAVHDLEWVVSDPTQPEQVPQ